MVSLGNCENVTKELESVKEINTVLTTIILFDHISKNTEDDCNDCSYDGIESEDVYSDEYNQNQNKKIYFQVDVEEEKTEDDCEQVKFDKLEIFLYDKNSKKLGKLTFPFNEISMGLFVKKSIQSCKMREIKSFLFRMHRNTPNGKKVEQYKYKIISPNQGYVFKYEIKVDAYTGSIDKIQRFINTTSVGNCYEE